MQLCVLHGFMWAACKACMCNFLKIMFMQVCVASMFCMGCLQCLHVHVFGNYWLGGFKDRDPEPIRARDTILFYIRLRDTIHHKRDTIHYKRDTRHYKRDTIRYYILRARAAPGPGFSYMGHQLISAFCILLISASLILASLILAWLILAGSILISYSQR